MSATLKKKYKYVNRITATVKPVNLKKVKDLTDTTGESASGIVDEALTEYFKNREVARTTSKNSY